MGEIGSQLMGVAPNDPALAPYFALAEEFDVPVLIHTEGIGPPVPGFRSAAGRPLLLEEVLVRHRNLRVFVENSGYPFLDEMIAMMYQYPQLYGDLSTITWIIPRSAFHRYVEALVRAGLGNRLMFGSDQMRWPEKIDEAIEAIEEADYLTAEQKRDILYNNAARFLRLERRRRWRKRMPHVLKGLRVSIRYQRLLQTRPRVAGAEANRELRRAELLGNGRRQEAHSDARPACRSDVRRCVCAQVTRRIVIGL
jgi:hypothetical protein